MEKAIKKISLAFSQDTDDAFMVYALQDKRIDLRGFEFEFIAEDIQKLNQLAKRGVYDISAVSMAMLPLIDDKYNLMPIGASIGDRFGPILVVSLDSPRKTPQSLENCKIAIPGINTSAYLASLDLLPPYQEVVLPFNEIAEAVLSGRCQAGILIHELQIDCSEMGLLKVADLGELWHERHQLPLPLGGIVIRKSLGETVCRELTEVYRASIEYALANRAEALQAASKNALAGFAELKLADKYISMYVNDQSLDMHADVKIALSRLFAVGESKGLYL